MESFIEHFGYLAVLVGTFLEGETVLILGGFAAHRGYLDLFWVIATAFAGTVCGDQLFYYLGHRHSHALLTRRPAWQQKIEKARYLIASHQILIILSFRFFYGLRAVIPFTLGLSVVSPRIFVPLNILGAAFWAASVGAAGYFFGHALEVFFVHLKQIEIWVMIGIALLGATIWVIYYKKPRGSAKTYRR